MASLSVNTGADVYKETLRSTAGNVTELGKGALEVLKTGVDGGIELETKYGVNAKIGGREVATVKLENKDEIIKRLEKDLEKKDKQIEKLEAKVEKLEEKVEASQDKFIAHIQTTK